MSNQKHRKNRQTKNRQLLLILSLLILPLYGLGQSQTTEKKKPKIDYSQRSNIIKEPEKLKGDEKAIFYYPFFMSISYKEARALSPFQVKAEFSKLGIETKERARFVAAYSFYLTYYLGHKKSCENWEHFKDLAPKTD